MSAMAANLIERVLPPQSGLRRWVLTFPFLWRRRLAQDGGLLGRLTRMVVETVLAFYAARAAQEDGPGAKTGAVSVVQRTSSDLRLNPHLHMIVLDGAWYEQGGELAWEGLGHLRTSEVGEVLEGVIRRIERHLRRRGLLRTFEEEAEPDGEGDPEGNLAASAVSGQAPAAGPQWVEPPRAARRAASLGLVRITLAKAYTDGTIAVDMYWKSRVPRLKVLGEEDEGGGRGRGADEVA
jgi:hypothetical protein